MAEPSKNDLIANRYSVLYTLGKGGMGIVFRCLDTTLQRDVAVKVLGDGADMGTVKRFQTEAKAAAKLQHENILQVMDFGETDGRLFLVMDYLDGVTLADLIREKTTLEPEEALPIFLQICDGIAHAHKKGVLHRDIKPSNIMLIETDSGRVVKIVDFGIAKISSTTDQKLTTTGTVVGSPLYISPEAGLGKKCDSRSDIYSLGCLMFEALTGKPPFCGDTAFETIMMHNNDLPPQLSAVTENHFDEHLERIIARCIEKQPQSRFQSIEELSKELLNVPIANKVQNHDAKHQLQKQSLDSSYAQNAKIKKLTISLIVATCVIGIISVGSISGKRILDEEKTAPSTPVRSGAMGLLRGTPTLEDLTKRQEERFEFNAAQNNMKINEDVDDKLLSELAPQFKKVATWNMQGAPIKGPGLESLADFPITSLELKETQIDGKAIESVAKMKRLNFLDVRKCPNLKPEDLRPLKELRYLTSIQLSLPDDPQDAFKTIQTLCGLPFIRFLTIDRDLTTEMIVELKRMKHLEQIKAPLARKDRDSKALGIALGALPNLVQLMSTNDGLGPVSVHELAIGQKTRNQQKKLYQLEFDLPETNDHSIAILAALAELPELKKLQVDGFITKEFLKGLMKLPRLKTLVLPTDFESQGVEKELETLRTKCKIETFKSRHRLELF